MRITLGSTGAILTLLAALTLACSDGAGPRQAHGISGTWRVTTQAMNEATAGRGTCRLLPTSFDLTVDSTGQGVGMTLPAGEQMSCTSGALFTLTPNDSAGWAFTGPSDSVYVSTFGVDSTAGEIVLLGWFYVTGDSAGGQMQDFDNQSFLPLGSANWTAVRQ